MLFRSIHMQPSASVSVFRATINQLNAQKSTGPRTEAGKQRSSRNALRHGLTARTAVLDSEDPEAYQHHCRKFLDEYQPANQTEIELVQELADTSWRLRRIPLLEPTCSPKSPAPSPWSPRSPASVSTAHASLASSKKHSSSSATSNMSAANTKNASSKMPPHSSNFINTKEFPGSHPTMASFFQKPKLNVAPNA